MGNIYHTVVQGEYLSIIAPRYNTTWQNIAAWNRLENPNLIYPGQKLIVGSEPDPGSSTTPSVVPKKKETNNSNKVKIDLFGLQSGTDRTVFVTWLWDKDKTKEYKVLWKYYTGDGIGFIGSEETTNRKQSLYTGPSNAKRVSVKIRPIAKTKTVNKKEVAEWTAEWCSAKEYIYDTSVHPKEPPVPTVNINGLKLVAELDNLDVSKNGLYADEIEFQVVKNNEKVVKTSKGKTTKKDGIDKHYASVTYTVDTGSLYKVRARCVKNKETSPWSDFSSNISTIPNAPANVKVTSRSSTEIKVDWDGVKTATSYEIQYTTKQRYFDSNPDEVQSKTVDSTVSHAEITGLETGQTYYIRVRAINDAGYSAWGGYNKSKETWPYITIGVKPGPPTTWSSTTTGIVGEKINLYWVHNSLDNSNETSAELELTIDGTTKTLTIEKSSSHSDEISVFEIDTNANVINPADNTTVFSKNVFKDGAKINWRVRTAGILEEQYGNWSTKRNITIYSAPGVEVELKDKNGDRITTVYSFPFYIEAIATPPEQSPIGYHISIKAKKSYETTDNVGSKKIVSKNEEIYSKYFDIPNKQQDKTLRLELLPNNIDLEPDISYRITCTVSMNSGLSASDTYDFDIDWEDIDYSPTAMIALDSDSWTSVIYPSCSYIPITQKKVNYTNGQYIQTDIDVLVLNGSLVMNAFTDKNEMVFRRY